MIDTFTMILRPSDNPFSDDETGISRHDFLTLYDVLEEEAVNEWQQRKGKPKLCTPTYTYFDYCGVKFSLFKGEYIKARVTPRKMIDPDNRIGLLKPDSVDDFISGFNDIMDMITPQGIRTPYIDDRGFWQASRVDYTADIVTPYTQPYLDLMKRNKSKYFQQSFDYETTDRRYCNSSCLNLYNKQQHLIDKQANKKYHGDGITDDDIEQAKGVLRLEYQCKWGKCKSLQNHFKWKDRNILHYLQPDTAIYVLQDLAQQYKGDFYTAYDDSPFNIYRQIERVNATDTTKALMTEITQRLANDYRIDMDDVITAMIESGISKDSINYALRQFKRNGINPIPISTRKSKEYRVRKLDGIDKLISGYIDSL